MATWQVPGTVHIPCLELAAAICQQPLGAWFLARPISSWSLACYLHTQHGRNGVCCCSTRGGPAARKLFAEVRSPSGADRGTAALTCDVTGPAGLSGSHALGSLPRLDWSLLLPPGWASDAPGGRTWVGWAASTHKRKLRLCCNGLQRDLLEGLAYTAASEAGAPKPTARHPKRQRAVHTCPSVSSSSFQAVAQAPHMLKQVTR